MKTTTVITHDEMNDNELIWILKDTLLADLGVPHKRFLDRIIYNYSLTTEMIIFAPNISYRFDGFHWFKMPEYELHVTIDIDNRENHVAKFTYIA